LLSSTAIYLLEISIEDEFVFSLDCPWLLGLGICGVSKTPYGPVCLKIQMNGATAMPHSPVGARQDRFGPSRQAYASLTNLLSIIYKGVKLRIAARADCSTTKPRQIRLPRGVSSVWSQLDPYEYPFACSVAGQLPARDDRMGFLAGVDLILKSIDSQRRRRHPQQ
jgi:hypothetical protein